MESWEYRQLEESVAIQEWGWVLAFVASAVIRGCREWVGLGVSAESEALAAWEGLTASRGLNAEVVFEVVLSATDWSAAAAQASGSSAAPIL